MTRTTSAAISTGAPETTAAGERLARLGGNAVDIAVGAALTATVSEILMASVGGSGFLMIHLPGQQAELIDGSDVMPQLPAPEAVAEGGFYKANLPYGDGIEVLAGAGSVAVPGALGAFELAWQRHGSLPWREIMAPAVELAKKTYPAGKTMAMWLGMAGEALFFPQAASRACFFPDGKTAVQQGDPFRVPYLDQTMEQISEEGARAFYQGDLGAAFAKEIQALGGFVDRADLAAYQAEVRTPLTLSSGGFELALNPPPAVGGSAVGALIRVIERAWKSQLTDAERALLHARAQSWLLDLRDQRFAHADFDRHAAREILERGDLEHFDSALQSPNTTHLSVATDDGSLVSVTLSMGYGSGVMIPQTGIACNNSLGEPELNPQGYFSLAPGSRLISNMAPSLGWHSDGRSLALGSPGASRITTSIVQTWIRYALEDCSFEQAVAAPRLHVERWHDGLRVQVEPGIDTGLLNTDYIVRPFEEPHMYFGAVKLAGRDSRGELQAVADERRHGSATVVHPAR